MIINAAVEEDVHVVGLSVLSGAHNALVPEIIEGVHKAGLTDVLMLVGGIIPDSVLKIFQCFVRILDC